MKTLRIGMVGAEVISWQYFLIGQGLLTRADGQFGPDTENSTKRFQQTHGLLADGVAGRQTLAKALSMGFGEIEDDDSKEGAAWPPKPNDLKPLTGAESDKLFGKFSFVPNPQPNNPEAIKLTDDWYGKNIGMVKIPQLIGVPGAPRSGEILFHRKAHRQLISLWQAWEDENLLDRVLTWHGSYVARFVRGSRTYLSNHSKGTAFDINASWNPLGAEPARVGKKGSVRELVELANYYGFYWLGHNNQRPDGMHFEVAKIIA